MMCLHKYINSQNKYIYVYVFTLESMNKATKDYIIIL